MQPIEIKKYTHYFTIQPRDVRHAQIVFEFVRTHQLLEMVQDYDPVTRRKIEVPRVWGGRLADNSSFRFPITLLGDFERLLSNRGLTRSDLVVTTEPLYQPAPASFQLTEGFVPYDYQEEAVAYSLTNRAAMIPSVLITMPPGTGKTITFAHLLCKLQLRAAMIIPPTYLEKWIADLKEYLNIPDERSYVFRGSASIRKAVALAERNEYDYDFTIMSLTTMVNFMKAYEQRPSETEDEYGCKPGDLMRILQIGVLGGDEVHEMFHALYWFFTFVHGPFHMGLSATMIDRDPFKEHKQKIIYPAHHRYDKIKMKKYINHINVGYAFENMDRDRIRTNFPRSKTYSQNYFDYTIYKNKKVLKNFLTMVAWFIDTFFLHPGYQPGDKLGLYFARVELINVVVEFVKQRYPQLDVRRFVGGDPYIDLIEPDIRVTTQGSGGTGKDIKKLTVVINFNNMDSDKANEQLLGRIREISERNDLLFVQAYCTHIKKHLKYKVTRDKWFASRTASVSNRFYGQRL